MAARSAARVAVATGEGVMMVAKVMVTVGMAAARAAVVAALYNVLSADAPVGAPAPETQKKSLDAAVA
jgi:hypothetical protein